MSTAARVCVVAVAVSGAGCGGLRVLDSPVVADLAWPAASPRVRLERIIEYRRGGALRTLTGEGGEAHLFARPYGLTWRGEDLLVADPGARRVLRIGADGRVATSAPDAVGAPIALAVCGGELIASDPEGGRVAALSADLRVSRWLASGLHRPTGLACTASTVYVVETGLHRILALEPDGATVVIGERGPGPGQFNFPTALAASGATLLVGDALNFRVQLLSAETRSALRSFGSLGDAAGETPRIKGLAVDAMGRVWVSDAHTDRVSLYTLEGELLLSLGGTGSVPGRFSFPAGIAAHPDGRVAVADALNRRIAIFRLLGQERSE